MSAIPIRASSELAIRLAAFAALAALGAWHWARLVTDPPVGRVALAVAVLTAGAAAVAWIGAMSLRRIVSWALAGVAALAATAVGLMAVGVPADHLAPEGWDRLGNHVGRGFAGLDGAVEYPYERGNDWSRLVLLAGLPLALGLAAALAFWPSRRSERGYRMPGLVALIAVYAIAATAVPPGEPLLWGHFLLVVVAAWLWLDRLDRRNAISAAALLALAGIVAVAAAGRLDAERPWIDYRSWQLSGTGGINFKWSHDYGPIDWPRSGATVLGVESDEPHYWRASVLDEFDGTSWLRPGAVSGADLEVPPQVEDAISSIDPDVLNPKWIERVEVTVGPMQSDLLLAPGAVIGVNGLETDTRPDGTTVVAGDEPLEEGDSYAALAYVPDPTARQLRGAVGRYYPVLATYTDIGLPPRGNGPVLGGTVEEVDVPLRGSAAAATGDPAARRRILASPYAETYRLAHRLTAGKPHPYEAVRAIETHLRSGPYEYNERVGRAGNHPLASFLHEDRSGYCQQFSGAMALMLRMVGIPSRVATGFSAGTHESSGEGQYLVSDRDAHSWVEVYFTGIGWVPFDPTPAAAPAVSQFGEDEFLSASSGTGSRSEPRPPGRTAEDATAAPSSAGDGALWTILLAALVLAGLAAGATAAARALRYRALSPAAAAEAQLRELRRGLTRVGLPIQPGETMFALEKRLQRHLGLATAAYVAKLRRRRFEPGNTPPPTLAERRVVRREFGSRSGPGKVVRVRRAFPLGGPRSRSVS